MEQLLLLSSVIIGMLIFGYIVKTQMKALSSEQKAAANETFNKSI